MTAAIPAPGDPEKFDHDSVQLACDESVPGPKRITVTIDGLEPIVFDASVFDVAVTDSRLELVARRDAGFAGYRLTYP